MAKKNIAPTSKFITFEGGEGAGKSTQIVLLESFLRDRGVNSIVTREPGGSPNSELIRTLLVRGASNRWEPKAEVLLHFAARHVHLKNTIWPALERGSWVLSDRFADSTMVYQGDGLGVSKATIEFLYRFVVGDFVPDLTFILDLPVNIGLARARARSGDEDRYESLDYDFHERVRNGFLSVAEAAPSRYVIIDGEKGINEVNEMIVNLIVQRFDVE